jgi:hypothetical protein
MREERDRKSSCGPYARKQNPSSHKTNEKQIRRSLFQHKLNGQNNNDNPRSIAAHKILSSCHLGAGSRLSIEMISSRESTSKKNKKTAVDRALFKQSKRSCSINAVPNMQHIK